MYVLSISILPNNLNRPFFRVEPNFRWVYAVSSNYPLLESFKLKITSFTNPEYIPYLNIEILPYDSLNENEIENNFYNPYSIDRFYIEGIVNNRSSRSELWSYTYDEFTPDKWNI